MRLTKSTGVRVVGEEGGGEMEVRSTNQVTLVHTCGQSDLAEVRRKFSNADTAINTTDMLEISAERSYVGRSNEVYIGVD